MTRTLFVLLLAIAWSDGHAQSSLPPCPDSPTEKISTTVSWTNCFGTFIYGNGNRYVGGYKNKIPFGEGSLISVKGFPIAEGIWRDASVVEVKGKSWRLIASADYLTLFIDEKVILQEGPFRRTFLMNAYSEPQPVSRWLSGLEEVKVDCLNERYKSMWAGYKAGPFGTGAVLDVLHENDWQYPQPDSIAAGVMKYVCEFKLAKK